MPTTAATTTPNPILTFLLNMLTGALTSEGEILLVGLLQKLHDKNVDQYKAAIFGGNALVKALQPLVSGTTTKIDDAFVAALQQAITESAATNGIVLT